MSYQARIIFGKEQVKKFHKNELFADFERSINVKEYTFEANAESVAFYKGIGEAIERLEFEVIRESEDKINIEKEDEDKFNYWVFIEKYFPKYHSCDNVLLSNILTKKLYGEKICKRDKKYIKGWDIRKELFELDKKLLCEAFENYFETVYPVINS
ncbi:hypothetical protein [Flavobacterium soyangense]|uniref:Uncharacterized protein n=1 Tax=Flavobacterium soyangense TaxID=2023265 RepID=A0A930U8N2_9FLAO|nr:hypothetical protein [Flavobacterium soyangense]MBF2707482.1 hypothetical protein [Flavobacterium soyangense]